MTVATRPSPLVRLIENIHRSLAECNPQLQTELVQFFFPPTEGPAPTFEGPASCDLWKRELLEAAGRLSEEEETAVLREFLTFLIEHEIRAEFLGGAGLLGLMLDRAVKLLKITTTEDFPLARWIEEARLLSGIWIELSCDVLPGTGSPRERTIRGLRALQSCLFPTNFESEVCPVPTLISGEIPFDFLGADDPARPQAIDGIAANLRELVIGWD